MGLPQRKTEQHYTFRDYRDWPNDERWELIDGVAYNMSPAPSTRHQGLDVELAVQIGSFLRGKPCKVFVAPCDVLVPRVNEQHEDDVDTVVQPDVLVVCDPAKIRLRGIWGAPDLVVEILSPWTSRKDQREKFDLYQRIGVKEYWVVDPNGCWLQQYVLGANGLYGLETLFENGTLVCPTLPGLTLDVGELWKGLTPLDDSH